jgi:hypothetical protein
VSVRDFDVLPNAEKQRWVEEAELSFEAVKPLVNALAPRPDYFGLAAALAQREAAKVIGRITPSEPFGVARVDDVIDARD